MSNDTVPNEGKTYPPIPPHWKVPTSTGPILGPLSLYLYRVLALVSVHQLSLEDHWKAKCDDEIYMSEMNRLVGQINNGNIVCGLILSTTAAFITTSPPSPSIINYSSLPAYFFMLLSFAQAIGSIITGTAVVAIYQSCERSWCRDVLTATRFRLYTILLLIAWPSISLFLSIIFLMGGLLIAVLEPRMPWIIFGASTELLVWAWILPCFICCTLPLRRRETSPDLEAQSKVKDSQEATQESPPATSYHELDTETNSLIQQTHPVVSVVPANSQTATPAPVQDSPGGPTEQIVDQSPVQDSPGGSTEQTVDQSPVQNLPGSSTEQIVDHSPVQAFPGGSTGQTVD